MTLVAVLGIATQVERTADAASANTVVSAVVPSATNISASGCPGNTPGPTDFGSVLPGSSVVLGSDCTIIFGSSNSTATLRVRQTDGAGNAMYAPTSGALDPLFGTAGETVVPQSAGAAFDQPYSLITQPDGTSIITGYCQSSETCMIRLTASGAVDPTFNASAAVAGLSTSWLAHSIRLDGAGRILLTDNCGGAPANSVCVRRLTTTGALDTTFGVNGKRVTGQSGSPGALTLLDNGSMLVSANCGGQPCVSRLTSSGAVDAAFGTNGVSTITIVPPNSGRASVFLQNDGTMLVALSCRYPALDARGSSDYCAVRLRHDGSLDTTYGTGGLVATDVSGAGNWDDAFASVATADGTLTIAGYCSSALTSNDFCLVRYLPDGTLDPGFGTSGIVLTPMRPGDNEDDAWDMSIVDGDRLLVTGMCDLDGNYTDFDACAARYLPTGQLDPTFGSGGKAFYKLSSGYKYDSANSVAVGIDGSFMIAGDCDAAGGRGFDFCVARIAANGSISQYVPGTSDWTTPATNHFGACLHALAGGANASWIPNASCSATDGGSWNAIPTAPSTIASTSAPTMTASVGLRFGMRVPLNQVPGRYVAPITFDVLAPAV